MKKEDKILQKFYDTNCQSKAKYKDEKNGQLNYYKTINRRLLFIISLDIRLILRL